MARDTEGACPTTAAEDQETSRSSTIITSSQVYDNSSEIITSSRAQLLLQLRRERFFRAMSDQVVIQAVVSALCSIHHAGAIDMNRLRPML